MIFKALSNPSYSTNLQKVLRVSFVLIFVLINYFYGWSAADIGKIMF